MLTLHRPWPSVLHWSSSPTSLYLFHLPLYLPCLFRLYAFLEWGLSLFRYLNSTFHHGGLISGRASSCCCNSNTIWPIFLSKASSRFGIILLQRQLDMKQRHGKSGALLELTHPNLDENWWPSRSWPRQTQPPPGNYGSDGVHCFCLCWSSFLQIRDNGRVLHFILTWISLRGRYLALKKTQKPHNTASIRKWCHG